MNKLSIVITSLLLAWNCAFGQIGSWVISVNRVGRTKETGIAYFTINANGTVVGYSLSTLTFSVATFSGTWTQIGRSTLNGTLTESWNNQTGLGSFQAKFSAKSFSGTITINGTTYTFTGKPATAIPNLSGTWSGIVTQARQKATEVFTASQDSDYPAVFNFK